jgi:hypothetical protein
MPPVTPSNVEGQPTQRTNSSPRTMLSALPNGAALADAMRSPPGRAKA